MKGLTYSDKTKDFQQILRDQNETTIHQRNLQVLMKGVYKSVNSIKPPIMNSLFQFQWNTHSIRNLRKLLQKLGKLSNMVRKQ